MFKELLNTEPFNVATNGDTTEWWNIDHRFSIETRGACSILTFEGENSVPFYSDRALVEYLEEKLGIPGLTDDYLLLAEREKDLDENENN